LGEKGKGKRVKQILDKMKEDQSGGGNRGDSMTEANRNPATFSVLVWHSWASVLGEKGKGRRMKRILNKMKEGFEQ